MDLTIQWQHPAIAASLRVSVEALVSEALTEADFLKHERRTLVVNFVPDFPSNSPIVGTIVEPRTGRLLGAVESPSDGRSIQVIRLLPNLPLCDEDHLAFAPHL